MNRETILLVDPDVRRRAAIAHALSGHAVHVEPFEDVKELEQRRPSSGILLVYDDGASLRGLLDEDDERCPWLPVIGFAQAPATAGIVAALHGGAIDYFDWPQAPAELFQRLDAAIARARQVSANRAREAVARRRIEILTRREREVLTGVAEGLSNRLIGERLAISPRTVEIHRANMLTKLGAQHTSEAIRVAIEAALVG